MYVDCIYYILMLLIMEVVICRIVMEYVLNCFLNVIICNKEICRYKLFYLVREGNIFCWNVI